MQIIKILRKIKKLSLLYMTMFFFFSSCTKTELKDNYTKSSLEEVTNKFFEEPQIVDKAVKKILVEIKARNSKFEFVQSFANNIGYPIWSKAIFSTINRSKLNTNLNNFNISKDSFVYIPFVKKDSNTVNGYILAKINNKVSLCYYLAQNYKEYSFSLKQNELNDASKFSLRILDLNKFVFGVNQYKIYDSKLFSTDTVHEKVQNLSFEGQNSQQNFTTQTNDAGCSITITTTTTCKVSAIATNPCHTTISSTMFCDPEWPGGGFPIPEGGGGGGDIPPYFPCIPNPSFSGQTNISGNSILPGGPLPPCPPDGTGWAPMQGLCSSSLNFIGGNDNSYWETYVQNLRFESGPNNINNFDAYFSLGNDITDYKMNQVIYPSPFGPGISPKTALEYLHDFFPTMLLPGSVDIRKIWDPSIQSYVWRFSKFAVQAIASRCSNLASINVSLQYYGIASTPGFTPAQIDFRTQTSAFLKCFSPTTGTTCRLLPSSSSNLSIANYSIGCL